MMPPRAPYVWELFDGQPAATIFASQKANWIVELLAGPEMVLVPVQLSSAAVQLLWLLPPLHVLTGVNVPLGSPDWSTETSAQRESGRHRSGWCCCSQG